jgi:gamma-glutamyl phosphate reductase
MFGTIKDVLPGRIYARNEEITDAVHTGLPSEPRTFLKHILKISVMHNLQDKIQKATRFGVSCILGFVLPKQRTFSVFGIKRLMNR